jgi:CBS domain-containing protein
MKEHLVKDWMSSDPVCIAPDVGIGVAHQMMLMNDVRRLPVVNDKDHLVGIVARSDIREARAHADSGLTIHEMHYRLATVQVREIMSDAPLTVSPDATVYDAARIMLDHKVGGLPVVDDGTLLGIITESDIFRMVVVAYEGEYGSETD